MNAQLHKQELLSQDWNNREYVHIVSKSILQLSLTLNRFRKHLHVER
jgi:hypothetical protein